MDSLRKQLNYCLENQIPVIMTVAVMGTTEEGSIDPLTEMLMMRNEFKKKGLNFCMHADAAWAISAPCWTGRRAEWVELL